MNARGTFAGFEYVLPPQVGINLGDNIQSIAVEQHHPQVTTRFNRENLANIHDAAGHILVMNGWFAHHPSSAFPPAAGIRPVFFGLHITENQSSWFTTPRHIDYFRQHQPIGCRDRRTAEILTAHGVTTYYSKCASLTFPRRHAAPENGDILFVDAEHIPAPESLRQRAMFLTQRFDIESLGIHTSMGIQTDYVIQEQMTKILLRHYHKAALVVTTRLHCALPCMAIGVPVVFFGDDTDTRVSILKDFHVPINKEPSRAIGRLLYHTDTPSRSAVTRYIRRIRRQYLTRHVRRVYMDNVNWSPAPVEMEAEKADIVRSLKAAIARVEHASPHETA